MLKINVVIIGTWTVLVAMANFMKNASIFCMYLHLFNLFLLLLTHVISIIISLFSLFFLIVNFFQRTFPRLIQSF